MKPVFSTFSVLALVAVAGGLSACGSSDTPAVPNFSSALSSYLPKAAATTSALRIDALLSQRNVSTMATCTGGDAYSTTEEAYAQSIIDGCGSIGRTMGGQDPLSIWMTMDTINRIGKLIEDGTIPVTVEDKTVTLPFGIGEAANSGTVTHTFKKDTLTLTDTLDGQTVSFTLDNITGGFTDQVFGVAFHMTFSMAGQKGMDARFLFYGELENSTRGLFIRATRHESEQDGTTPTPDRVSRAIFMFDAAKDASFYKYSAASEYKWLSIANGGTNATENVWNRVSIIMSGTKLNAAGTGKFIVKKRAMHCNVAADKSCTPNTSAMGEQFFAVDYVGPGQFGAAEYAHNYGSTFANWTSTTPLTDTETSKDLTAYGDTSYLVPANMHNIETMPATLLPASQAELTPNW